MIPKAETIEIEVTIDSDNIEITETGWSDDYDGGRANGVVIVNIGIRKIIIPVTAYTRSRDDNIDTPHTRHWVMGTEPMDFEGAHEALESTAIYQIVSRGRIHEIAEMATDAFLDVVEEATNDHDNDDHEALVELIRRAKEKAEEAE